MSNLGFNPDCKDYFKAKACLAISVRYNYAGSYRSDRFKYLSFRTWSSSYRAAFCYLFKRLEDSFVLLNASPSIRLSFVYNILNVLIKYNIGEVRYDLVSSMFEEQSAIRYAASKYFPGISFSDIESDFVLDTLLD